MSLSEALVYKDSVQMDVRQTTVRPGVITGTVAIKQGCNHIDMSK